MTTEVELHETSLAAWAVPATVAAGERFAVTIGVKSFAGCGLAGRSVAVRDGTGAVLAEARLGETPWPGTDALYWTEVALRAPDEPGRIAWTAHFDAGGLDEPHLDAAAPFDVTVVAGAEHSLTVTVMADGAPVEDAYVRLGPYRAVTDAAGRAAVRLAAGGYELQVWKAGYDVPTLPLDIAADAAVSVEARLDPEPDPDAVWTA